VGAYLPGLTIFVMALGANLLGDACGTSLIHGCAAGDRITGPLSHVKSEI